MPRALTLALIPLILCGCPPRRPPPPEPSGRCEVDLEALGIFGSVGNGALARVAETEADLLQGSYARGRPGDIVLENERIRVVISAPGREISAAPFGGNIIDADVRRPAGVAGQDAFGKLELIYGFGRTVNHEKVEILRTGETGGMAVVAATGSDTVLDYVNLPAAIDLYLPGVKFPFNPDDPLPLKATTYYVLSPGESRVRVLTSFCNSGSSNVVTGVGDLVESGGEGDVFNPTGCTGTLGYKGCFIDSAPWFGHQYAHVAYAVRPFKFQDLAAPEKANAVLYIAGISAMLAAGEGQSGLLTWLDASATKRPGAFGIIAGQQRNFLRDFVVGKDLAEIQALFLLHDGAQKARANVAVSLPDGVTPAPGARVAIVSPTTGKEVALLVTDANGLGKTDLPPGNYVALAALPGRALENPSPLIVPTSGEVSASLRVGTARTLNVTVRDPFGRPLTSKVLVSCPSDPCPFPVKAYRLFWDLDDQPTSVAAIAYVPPQGNLAISLPPGQYEVRVMRGPEYSMWPDTAPLIGATVDLTAADASLDATLARVLETQGWMSADLHVHAVNSPDSNVGNAERALSFAAEGVDVLVSTDHDAITDFAPVVRDLGAEAVMATMIGCEVTPFDYGHLQAYPLIRREQPNGGAFDWAGGIGPSLRPDQIFAGLRAEHPNVVLQMNHPRGFGGALSQLRVDTATSESHARPETFRLEPVSGATATGTKIFSNDFDAMEVMNGTSANLAVMNDWMTFLSRGLIKTATAVSDTHNTRTHVGGYSRTWVKVGTDLPTQFDASAFAAALKAQRAFGSNGPVLQVTAQAVSSTGAPLRNPAEIGGTVSIDPAAGEQVELTIDVQSPEWLTFDTIEVYTHTTGREAFDGVANTTWPEGRIHKKVALDPLALPVEAVPGLNGFLARRIHVVQKIAVAPAADTWFVVFVRGTGGGSSPLFPLAWHGVACDSGTGLCAPRSAKAWAYSNPVFVDANGTGAYDDFPLKQGLRAARPRSAVPAPPTPELHAPTAEELTGALKRALAHEADCSSLAAPAGRPQASTLSEHQHQKSP